MAQRRLHGSKKLYTCPVCGEAFRNRALLNEHARLHCSHGGQYGRVICDESFCQRFAQATRLSKRGRTYACEVCAKMFINKGKLSRHRKIHSIKKWQKCDACAKRFVDKKTRARRSREHGNCENPRAHVSRRGHYVAETAAAGEELFASRRCGNVGKRARKGRSRSVSSCRASETGESDTTVTTARGIKRSSSVIDRSVSPVRDRKRPKHYAPTGTTCATIIGWEEHAGDLRQFPKILFSNGAVFVFVRTRKSAGNIE